MPAPFAPAKPMRLRRVGSDATADGMAIDFPNPGQATLLEWNEAAQRFEIVGIIAVPEE